jgi:hypothetical protein
MTPVPYGLRYTTFSSYVPITAAGQRAMAEYERRQKEAA